MTHFAVLTLLYKLLGLAIVTATVLAFGCSLIVSYVLNRSFTFRSRVAHQYGAPKFTLVTLSGLAWNISIMYTMVEALSANYYVSFLTMSMFVAGNNYLLSKKWVF